MDEEYYIVKYISDGEVMGVIEFKSAPWHRKIVDGIEFEPITEAQFETYKEFDIEELTYCQVVYRSDG